MKTESLHAVEATLLRCGLALIFLWDEFMKFTACEAAGIRPLAKNGALMSWFLAALGVHARSIWSMSEMVSFMVPPPGD
jgi:uncharacterized membrane protein YkgB